jgi:hypothetical protein
MNSHMMGGFADELEKLGSTNTALRALGSFMRSFKKTKAGQTATGRELRGAAARFQRSPEYRSAVGRGAAGGGDDSAVERFLRGAAGGAAAGALTGAHRPGWFGRKAGLLAEGETVTRLGKKARKSGSK